jgi:hypothetical protein
MAYLGNKASLGENNSFKILDDLAFTTTFNGSDGNVVNHVADTITINNHRFLTGSRVTYTNGGGNIGGLTNGTVYFTIKVDHNTIKLATNASNANSGTAINITGTGTGNAHTLSVAFDGVNTKFVATYDGGTKAQMTRAAQLFLSHNGVIQRPHDSTSPANGYGIDSNGSVVVFSAAPSSSDVIFGNLVANNFPTFDISDNKVDTFTADGSTTTFTLSRAVVNNDNILVALDGVIQYPSDHQNVRAYSVSGTGSNSITFASAPAQGTIIHVRHIGFAGASTSGVTGFLGRSGNVSLIDSDPVVGIQSGGLGIGTVRTLNFVGAGNTFKQTGNTIDISIAGGGGASVWTTSITGIQTSSAIVGVGTTSTDDADLQGIGNSARGLYVSNGMILYDNAINGNHYIGTSMNGLMAGPVSVNGVLNVDGNFVVV